MDAHLIVHEVARRGGRLSAVGGSIHVAAEPGAITDSLRECIRDHKASILDILKGADSSKSSTPIPPLSTPSSTPKGGGVLGENTENLASKPSSSTSSTSRCGGSDSRDRNYYSPYPLHDVGRDEFSFPVTSPLPPHDGVLGVLDRHNPHEGQEVSDSTPPPYRRTSRVLDSPIGVLDRDDESPESPADERWGPGLDDEREGITVPAADWRWRVANWPLPRWKLWRALADQLTADSTDAEAIYAGQFDAYRRMRDDPTPPSADPVNRRSAPDDPSPGFGPPKLRCEANLISRFEKPFD